MSTMLEAIDTRSRWIVLAAVICGLFVVWATQTAADSGLKGFAIGAAVLIAPIAIYLAFTKPAIFPYTLYAAFIPFDAFAQLGGGLGTITRFMGLLAGLALLMHAIRTRKFVMPPRALWWAIALLAWVLFSVLWSSDPMNAPIEANTLLMTVVLYAIIAMYPTKAGEIPYICNAIVIGGVASAFLGIYEFHHQSITQAHFVQNFSRLNIQVGSISIDPNLYSDALILPFGIMAARWLKSRNFVSSLLPLAAMVLFVIAVDIAASREAILAFALELLVIATVLKTWRRLIPLLIAMVAGLVAVPNVILRAIADQGNGGSGRTAIWSVGYQAFRQHPLIGSGSGSFAAVYDQWYLRVFQPYEAGWHRASHDILIHYGVEFGLIGLVLVFGIWLAQLKAVHFIPKGIGFDDLRAVLFGSLAGLALISLVVDAFDVKFLWLAFGLIAQVRAASISQIFGRRLE